MQDTLAAQILQQTIKDVGRLEFRLEGYEQLKTDVRKLSTVVVPALIALAQAQQNTIEAYKGGATGEQVSALEADVQTALSQAQPFLTPSDQGDGGNAGDGGNSGGGTTGGNGGSTEPGTGGGSTEPGPVPTEPNPGGGSIPDPNAPVLI